MARKGTYLYGVQVKKCSLQAHTANEAHRRDYLLYGTPSVTGPIQAHTLLPLQAIAQALVILCMLEVVQLSGQLCGLTPYIYLQQY